uniref:Uncharacterized protein n=1 Tax=Ciona intestinalis TaxID=7719 RepID=H2XMZ4_CIOIN|nr:uncharacterized protein C22orf15-like [Ciona intestinalis]|eukprot:XP_002120558.1 uncharacterized protein C22orf15-like [Ciona intestinalis]
MSTQLFITVRYGENKEELFNPHCKSLLLLECIREKCRCGDEAILDLVDEAGNVSNISDKENLTEYASQYLEGRRKYVLIKVIRSTNVDTEPHKYESLLLNLEKHYPELAERLDRLSRPAEVIPKGKNWQGSKKRSSQVSKTKSPKRNSLARIL